MGFRLYGDLSINPVVKTEMLIRKPVAEVYEAFINPAITTKFWFTKSSGRLEPNKQIQWDWEMYHLSVQVGVKKLNKTSVYFHYGGVVIYTNRR